MALREAVCRLNVLSAEWLEMFALGDDTSHIEHALRTWTREYRKAEKQLRKAYRTPE